MKTSDKPKRPAHRPSKYPGEPMTTLSVRLPARLKEKVLRLGGGQAATWICKVIEKTREPKP